MRWKAKYTRTDYPSGATRLKRCFAWRPVYISGVFVWLEFFEVLQAFKISSEKTIIDGVTAEFSLGKWINLSKRCI